MENGLDGMAQAIGILMNEVLKAEQTFFLGAEPHQRTAARQGYANGKKPKTVKSRIGPLE